MGKENDTMADDQKQGKLSRRELFRKAGASAAGAALLAAGLSDGVEAAGDQTEDGKGTKPTHLRDEAVEIICVLDRSGSMRGKEGGVIDGFNKFVEDQRAEPGAAALTLVLFDDHFDVVHSRADLHAVPPLGSGIYFPRGETALWDAMGKSIGIVRGNVPDSKKVIVLVMTDGQENASREYDGESLKSLIQEREAAGWAFMFVGADVDAITMAHTIGIGQNAYNVAPVMNPVTGKLETRIAGRTGAVGPAGSAGTSGSVGLGMAAMSVGTRSFRRKGEVDLEEWAESAEDMEEVEK